MLVIVFKALNSLGPSYLADICPPPQKFPFFNMQPACGVWSLEYLPSIYQDKGLLPGGHILVE